MGTGSTLSAEKHKGIVTPFVDGTVRAATSSEVILTGEGTRAFKVAGGGGKGYWVTGDKTVTITDSAYVESYVYGGFMDNNGGTSLQTLPDNDLYENVAPKYTENNATITVNVTNGASTGTIYGGSYYGGTRLGTFAKKNYGADYWFSSDNALALKDAININVQDAEVRGSIFGAGSNGSSVDDKVTITVGGNSIIASNIYAGSNGSYADENGSVQTFIDSSLITINGGEIGGSVYGGNKDNYGLVGRINEGTKIVLNGGTVKGSVYSSGTNDELYGGSHVVINGAATVEGDIIGGLAAAKDDSDHTITFNNHGDVKWDKVDGFNVVELTGGTSTTLGEDTDHTLSTDFEKVVITGPSTTVTGKIGHAVELDITNDCWVELKGDSEGNLTTNAGSVIKDNTTKNIVIHGNANFNGTKIENSTIKADGNIGVLDGSTVKDANLVATNGNVGFNGSTMEGGEITIGGKPILGLKESSVNVDTINVVQGGKLVLESDHSALVVADDIKLLDGHITNGSSLTANSVAAEGVTIANSSVTATEGNVELNNSNDIKNANLTAENGSVKLTDSKMEGGNIVAENGVVKFNQSSMNGGNIVAGEALQMDNASVVVVDSINNGEAVNLQVPTGSYWNIAEGPTAASLTVNDDLVLADGSRFEGHNKIESSNIHIAGDKNVDALLTAHSIKSEGAVTFDRATVTATQGNIELSAGSSVTNTNLVATDSVQLNGTTMKGGSIDAGNKVVLNTSEVSVNSIGKGGSAVVDSNKSQLEVTQGALVLDAGSVVKDSVLSSKEGVELRGTTMTGSTVKTDGVFFVTKQSDVTMDSVEGLNKIEISDSSFTTGKVELSQGETITSKTSNFTATDLVVNGGNFAADGTIKANSITVSDKGTIQIGDAAGKSKTQMELNATGSQSGLVSGKLEITNTDLVVTGSSSSQFWIDGGTMLVDGKSNVDLSVGTTLRVGSENAGELIVQGGSTLTGGANNLWVYDGSTITVKDGSTMGVCNDTDHYNYRVLMGITNHDGIDGTTPTQNLNVQGGSTFTSSATQFVTNFHGNTTTNISVSGKDSLFLQTGQNVNNNHYVVGTSGEWVQNADGKWLDKGSTGDGKYVTGNTDTITYLLSNGTDKDGVLGYAVSNAKVNISATEGGRVQFDSALTYVGNVGVNADYIKANESNLATFTVGKDSSMSFKQMEVYAKADVKNDGAFSATNINVNNGGIFNYEGSGELTANSLGVDKGGVMNLGSETVRSNVELNGSGQTGIISGTLNVTNTDLVVTGSSSSQFWIDGGTMTVDKGSKVDLSVGTTLRVGNENAGVLNVQGGSTLTGGANNLWVYDNSTINVSGKGSVMGVCNDTDHYNYRVLMGITNHNGAQGSAEQYLNVTDGGKFTSSATQFVTNFHSNTTTNITVSGENSLFHQTGQNVNNGHYVVGTTGEWVQNADGKWLDKGSTGDGKYVTGNTDTITYLLSNGTDKDGVLGYAVADAKVNISAKDGGAVKFDSALTYVGNVGVSDAYIKANESNEANFYLSGANSSISFKEMQMYANTNVNYDGDTNSTFSASKITVNNGATLNVNGNGKDSGSQFILTGTGKSNDEALVVDGTMNIDKANLVINGSNSQLGIGYGADKAVMNVTNSKVDLSDGTTLHIGYNANTSNSELNIKSSEFIGGSNNAWLGGGTINVTDGSTLSVCTGDEDHYNYRVLMGLKGNTVNLNVASGSHFVSSASQFVTNFNDGTTVNINVKGADSTLVHNKEIESSPSYGITKTTTYLLDSGTDANGNKYDAVNNVKTNITASEGGKVSFNSDVTYVGSAQDKAAGYTNKKLNISVADSASSVTFGDMVIYADTTIDNKGDKADFSVGNISVNDGATLETLGSLDLNEVALAGGTLFNAGTLELDSLVLEHASLLFAVSDWETAASTINYNGAELTNFRNLTVSINDMVDSYGIVLTGTAASDLIAAGDAGVEFSFTLATGSDLFEEQLAYVLNAEENLADFSITVGDAVLRLADGELKDLKVEDTAEGVVISGIAVIPEPTTATLSLLALAALAARRRRR